ncbi:MAG: hypothetical protein H6811_01190 [Phycisphaeraceae bacterium]|nr:hypothetical protein [Phycisphaeraceae bacterium]
MWRRARRFGRVCVRGTAGVGGAGGGEFLEGLIHGQVAEALGPGEAEVFGTGARGVLGRAAAGRLIVLDQQGELDEVGGGLAGGLFVGGAGGEVRQADEGGGAGVEGDEAGAEAGEGLEGGDEGCIGQQVAGEVAEAEVVVVGDPGEAVCAHEEVGDGVVHVGNPVKGVKGREA